MKTLLVIALFLVGCAKDKLQTDVVTTPPNDDAKQILLLEQRILELEQQEKDVNVYITQVTTYVLSVSPTAVVSHVIEVKEAEEIKEHGKKEKDECNLRLKQLKEHPRR